MKKIDLNNKTKEELSNALVDLNNKLLKLNFDLADNKVQDVSQIGKTKKDIARVMTMLNQVNK